MIAWFARNGVAANLFMGIILISGFFSIRGLKMELFPDFDLDLVTISVPYPGAAPLEVEDGICKQIEEKIWDLDGIKEMTSFARENVGVVSVQVERTKDAKLLADEIKVRVDSILNFPDEAEKAMVEVATQKRKVLAVAIHGKADPKSLRKLADKTLDDLTNLSGITQVEIAGIRKPEIGIEVSENALREHGMSFDDVARALKKSSVDIPGGVARTSSGETLLRSMGKARDGREFNELEVMTTANGSNLKLNDLAWVKDGFEDKVLYTEFSDEPAVTLRVFRVGNQSPLDISKKVSDYVEKISPTLPEGLSMTIWKDSSFYLQGRLEMMVRNAFQGLLLVFLVLSLFLRPSLAIWVAIGLPISFMGAFATMGLVGASINLVSLFAFIVVLGILVDDAIVVGESVYTLGSKGEKPLQASIKGTHLVAMPVTFAIITSMVAFVPMLFLPGWLGKLMKDIPLVVIPALFFSLVESKFILPYHLSLCRFDKLPKNWISKLQNKVSVGLEKLIETVYQPFLKVCLEWRYLTLSIFMGLLFITVGLIIGGHVPSIRGVPPVPSDYISVKLSMEDGVPAKTTEKALLEVERARLEVVDYLVGRNEPNPFRYVMKTMGAQPFSGGPKSSSNIVTGSNLGEISVELIKSEDRTRSAPQISALWRDRIGPLPGVKGMYFGDVAAGGSRTAIDIEIAGHDLDNMSEAADKLKNKLATYEGLFDISDTYSGGKREMKIRLKPNGRSLGLTQADLGRQVRQAYYGEEIQRIQRERDEVKVMLRYPLADRKTLTALSNLRVRAPNGVGAPLEEVATIELGQGYPTIKRSDRARIISVQTSADKVLADIPSIENDLDTKFIPALREEFPNIRFSFVGEKKEQEESDSGLAQAGGICLFVIYALLAIPFRSYLQPFLIMSVIPFGLIGAVLGHFLFGLPLSQLSHFGLVALTGVVINDSLVLVHYVNQRAKETTLLEATRLAGMARFRAILLTSLTTFVGLLPILFERSLQAQFLKPMAIAIGFGVLFATFITLLMVPCLYLILEDLKKIGTAVLLKLGIITNAPIEA
ncbi:MAG: efflux RND transporter permease subunit [Verrucomicrobiota bacterium]|nr:efflux RND transporter permease subunit [Verrucomicrobiota bacterium]